MENHNYINSMHCKNCKSEYDREWYAKNRERLLVVRSIYDKSEQGRKAHYESTYRQISKYPEKYSARNKLRNAVRAGKIIKPEVCTINSIDCEGRIEAHHYLGYEGEHWKSVKWLCSKHHRIEEGRWVN